MRRLALMALCGVAACGDNLVEVGEPLARSSKLIVVAHPDDDLLFMQPDVLEAVQSGAGITTVYVTAGDDNRGVGYAEKRYEGLRAAYGASAGSNDWHCGWIDLAGHSAQHCRLDAQQVSLVFLGYPDGGEQGQFAHSLLKLWEGEIDGADTVAVSETHYDRAALIETVAEVMRETQPQAVHTLDIASTHGTDHTDHMIVGAISLLAMASADSHADLISHRAYNVDDEPPNKQPAIFNATLPMMGEYDSCTTTCGHCGDACTSIDPGYAAWLERGYAIGFRRGVAGTLRIDGGCLDSDLSFGACETATAWQLDDAGELRAAGGGCIEVSDDGELAMTTCTGGVHQRFFFDDEGRLWSGVPPLPVAHMDFAHLWCLAPTEAGVGVRLCGADHAPAWELSPDTVTTQRADLLITATGRQLQLGDLTGDGHADLCAIENGLVCATGDGAGGFAAATRLDSIDAPLAIDPNSLTLGDVDGDGRLDACGRDANGVLCARAATNFAAERWMPMFGDDVAVTGTSASLTAIDADADGVADLCGLTSDGVICVSHAHPDQPLVRSTWSGLGAVVWPAELDGDQKADWCTATDNGVACAVQAENELTTDGATWSYSAGGVVEAVPTTTATIALGDIDGDGRADLCKLNVDRVVCARSQGRAFGPSTTLAILPSESPGNALLLGDLDGDGRADACVDAGTAIICAVASGAAIAP